MFEFEVNCQIPSQNKVRFAGHIFKEFFGKFQKNNYWCTADK